MKQSFVLINAVILTALNLVLLEASVANVASENTQQLISFAGDFKWTLEKVFYHIFGMSSDHVPAEESLAFSKRESHKGSFPANFKWGFATASYQIEGGWNEDGKGPSIWDTFTHREESPIDDGSTGDVACDSYHQYSEDIKLLKNANANFYRFSLSWSRILPNGTLDVVNQAGINFYNRLIDDLISNGIEPMVTLYHWDLPEALMTGGGWPNEELIGHFANYARLVFGRFGDRVKTWITFNEPLEACLQGYERGSHAPGISDPAELPYLCGHTILKSHALAYRIYEKEFKSSQNGQVGITLNCAWCEPGSNSTEDIHAAERAIQFQHGWFGSPIFFGKYPDVMREYIDAKSKKEGRKVSRLPEFDAGWSFLLKGSWDFLGFNHYSTNLVKNAAPSDKPGWTLDQDTYGYSDPSWEGSASSWLKVVPWGFRAALNWIKKTYGNPNVFVTENGFSDDGSVGLNDTRRINYYKSYIENMLQAINEDGCNVTAYTAWSLVDNFEWARGYLERFGSHYVDFTDPKKKRTPKESAKFLAKIFANNGFKE